MGFFEIFKSDPIKKKILAIRRDMKTIIAAVCDERYWIDWFGSYDVHPKYLAFWICVKSDDMKMKLKSDEELYKKLRSLLDQHGYPIEGRDGVFIGFESQETVDRESHGRWEVHLQ
ncbi:hypothetical protein [Mucilaginibacter celer]|uniref:Uncharacterized protein n=1 Tax=Mucilaginibacter celer TaxID=2305508 RepID=A0A494VLW2_9SPHI|nr:hypothetical protein [Mucilaginibacter celer]AYL93870.1 hypothetical protein HYN43_000520 [Mucilaginibacter celer]